jgi:hypothetical protein
LWRGWVVVSLFWIAFATWGLDPFSRFQRLSDPVKFLANNTELVFPGNTERQVVKKAITEWIQEQRDTQSDEPPEKMADKITVVNHGVLPSCVISIDGYCLHYLLTIELRR